MKLQLSRQAKMDRDELIVRAFRRLYEPLCGYIRKRTGDIADIEDMVQDVFLSLLSSDRIFTQQSVAKYAYACARNRVMDYFRHRACTDRAAEYFSNLCCVTQNEGGNLFDAGLFAGIEGRVLAGTGEKGCEVYLLAVYAGLSAKEIAARMEISERTAENHLQRVRGRVREEIRKVI